MLQTVFLRMDLRFEEIEENLVGWRLTDLFFSILYENYKA